MAKSEKKRKLVSLLSSIDGETYTKAVFALIDVVNNPSFDGVDIIVNSSGGNLSNAMHIISLMEEIKNSGRTVSTHVSCKAFSSASLIAISGTEGLRTISRFGRHLIHPVKYVSDSGMHEASPLQNMDKSMVADLYNEFCGKESRDVFLDSYKNGDTPLGKGKCLKMKLADSTI